MSSGLRRISRWASPAASLSLLVGALAAGPPSARAGHYHVYSCRTPSGESAPANGWTGSKTGTDSHAEDTCSQPNGALVAALGDRAARTANTDVATWAFAAPAAETLTGATLWRAGDTEGGTATNATYQFWLAGAKETEVFDECLYSLACPVKGNLQQPVSVENRIAVPLANLGAHLYMSASCGGVNEYKCPEGKGDPNGYAAVVYLYAADMILEQSAGPTASNVNGELASAPAVQGTSDVAFNATDPGSGVYEAVFTVDGQVVQSTVVDENGGRCRNVGQTSDGLAGFLYVQPCLGSVSVDVGFDTTKVGNGSHHLIVSVIDAAGNPAPVLDREITIDNPPAPAGQSQSGGAGASGAPGPANGTNASVQAMLAVRWKSTRSESLTSSYGRPQTITGRLTGPGGAPISGALIDLHATPAYQGARPVTMASPRTGRDGGFTVGLSGGLSSRTLRFAYRIHLDEALPAATRTLTLNVRAGLSLTIAPRTASVGRSIFFRGSLRGGPIPAAGKQIVLEARSPGGSWIEFQVIRTDARGRYRASYAFKFPGPARYQFRALSEPESDYPFAAGFSNVVRVLEG